jgi:hypothetical protein
MVVDKAQTKASAWRCQTKRLPRVRNVLNLRIIEVETSILLTDSVTELESELKDDDESKSVLIEAPHLFVTKRIPPRYPEAASPCLRRRSTDVEILRMTPQLKPKVPSGHPHGARSICGIGLRTCPRLRQQRAPQIQMCAAYSWPVGRTSCRWRESS